MGKKKVRFCKLCEATIPRIELEHIISGIFVCKKCFKLIFKYKKILKGKGYIEVIDSISKSSNGSA